jgi:hypothetical protein
MTTLLVASLLMGGCATGGGSFVVTEREAFKSWKRDSDAQGGPAGYPQQVTTIGSSQYPVAWLAGYEGKTITLRISNLATGEIEYNQSFYIPYEYWATSTTKRLQPGNYTWEIVIGGVTVASSHFEVIQ